MSDEKTARNMGENVLSDRALNSLLGHYETLIGHYKEIRKDEYQRRVAAVFEQKEAKELVREVRRVNSSLAHERDMLLARTEKLTAEKAADTELLQALTEEMKRVKDDYEARGVTNGCLRTENQSLADANAGLMAELETSQQEMAATLAQLDKTIESRSECIRERDRKIDELANVNAALRDELNIRDTGLEKYKTLNLQLSDKLANANKIVNAQGGDIADLRKTIAELVNQNGELLGDMNRIHKAFLVEGQEIQETKGDPVLTAVMTARKWSHSREDALYNVHEKSHYIQEVQRLLDEQSDEIQS